MDCLVVGAGAVADRYLDSEALAAASISVPAVCDLDADRAERAAARRDAVAYDDLETALAAEDAPLVLNLASHGAHAAVTRAALDADRHVFSEKPLATDGETARELVRTAAARDLALGCAPINDRCPGQRRAGRALADGRLGRVGLAYAHAHVGRVTEWHDRPDSFLDVGPLYDGAVYPLSLLVAWFGPAERVATADVSRPWADREDRDPEAPTHVEAVVEFVDGPRVRLTTSMYAPHRSREFVSLELHGDDGSLYLDDAGALGDARDRVQFGRVGREYAAMPPQRSSHPRPYVAGPDRLATALGDGRRPLDTARRAAHVVAICDAVEQVGETGEPASVPDCGVTADRPAAPDYRPERADRDSPAAAADRSAAVRLPPVGVELTGATTSEDATGAAASALDAGARLLVVDAATAAAVGAALADPGAPSRRSVHLASRVRDGGDAERACADLGVDALDTLLVDAGEAPSDRLAAARRRRDGGHARTIGVDAGSLADVEPLLDAEPAPPAVVCAMTAPSRPRDAVVTACQQRGVGVLVSAPEAEPLTDETAAVADELDVTPRQVRIAWQIARGVVPLCSPPAVADALCAGGLDLTADQRARLDSAGGAA